MHEKLNSLKLHSIQEAPRSLHFTPSGHSKSDKPTVLPGKLLVGVAFVGDRDDKTSTDWELEAVNWIVEVALVFDCAVHLSRKGKLTTKAIVIQQIIRRSSAVFFCFRMKLKRSGHQLLVFYRATPTWLLLYHFQDGGWTFAILWLVLNVIFRKKY